MLEYASLRLLAGDPAGYRRLCARLVERSGDASDLGIVDNLSRVCTPASEAVRDPALAYFGRNCLIDGVA